MRPFVPEIVALVDGGATTRSVGIKAQMSAAAPGAPARRGGAAAVAAYLVSYVASATRCFVIEIDPLRSQASAEPGDADDRYAPVGPIAASATRRPAARHERGRGRPRRASRRATRLRSSTRPRTRRSNATLFAWTQPSLGR